MTNNFSIKLTQLLKGFTEQLVSETITITDISLDSRQLSTGALFVAIDGAETKGTNFLVQAKRAGAVAALVDASYKANKETELLLIAVPDLSKKLGDIAARFFGSQDQALVKIGVTGTNGKSSVCSIVAQLLGNGLAAATIGTLGFGAIDNLKGLLNTTPDAITTQRILAQLNRQGTRHVSIEASSIGLDQNRLQGTQFKYAIFTNLTQDHLDYHGSMQAYGEAKKILFRQAGLKAAILNVDDEFSLQLEQEISPGTKLLKISKHDHSADIYASHVFEHRSGVCSLVTTPWGTLQVDLPLYGRFNIQNLLCAVAVWGLEAEQNKIDLLSLKRKIEALVGVPGRMQKIISDQGPQIIIDYAHTPDAIGKMLRTVRRHGADAIWCVFGCGGDRDREKRPMMANTAADFADNIVITSDNPRSEDPGAIVKDIKKGMPVSQAVTTLIDRREAIEFAVKNAPDNAVVVIAGKGHEKTQDINGVKSPFDDVEIARTFLFERNGSVA